jgi:hypothetical protein
MFTSGYLSKIRINALRRGVWYRALNRAERGILVLASKVVDEVSSLALAKKIVQILAKLRDASKSPFTRYMETHGLERTRRRVEQALSLGYEEASEWLYDLDFIRYNTMVGYNNT